MSLQLTGSPSPVSLGWGCEFPRFLHPLMLLPAPEPRVSPRPGPSALIASGFQVAPNPRSDDRLPMRPQVAPIAAPSGLAYGESPGCPEPSLRLRRLPASLQVSPATVPSGSTGWLISGSPRISPSGGTVDAYPGFPGSCIYGWVDDEPGSTRTLHPTAEPRDESSRPIGRRIFFRPWMPSRPRFVLSPAGLAGL